MTAKGGQNSCKTFQACALNHSAISPRSCCQQPAIALQTRDCQNRIQPDGKLHFPIRFSCSQSGILFARVCAKGKRIPRSRKSRLRKSKGTKPEARTAYNALTIDCGRR